jgi:hypothetical protein
MELKQKRQRSFNICLLNGGKVLHMPVHKYYAVIEPEEDVFIVTFPD